MNPTCRGPILLATDGTSRSGVSVLAARLLAAQLGARLEVVSVLDPIPTSIDPGSTRPPSTIDIEDSRRKARETIVQDFVSRFSGGSAPPRVHVRTGLVAQEVARAARDLSATMIVVGSAPRERRHRIVSGELAAQVLRSTDCPVLSVPPSFTALPKNVLVGIDFGPSSVRAVQAALLLLSGGGTLTLAHVLPRREDIERVSELDESDVISGVNEMFDRLRGELDPYIPSDVTVDTRLVNEYPSDGLLRAARATGADLVAVGTHGPNLLERLLVGSVASNVLHRAEVPVLAAPPPAPSDALALWLRIAGVAVSKRPAEWGPALDAFTRRNAGRGVIMEVDDAKSGSRVTNQGYALVGVTYDPSDRCVEIMVSDTRDPMRHVTRSVAHPDSITMVATDGWRDEVLEVRRGREQTVVMVEPGTLATEPRV